MADKHAPKKAPDAPTAVQREWQETLQVWDKMKTTIDEVAADLLTGKTLGSMAAGEGTIESVKGIGDLAPTISAAALLDGAADPKLVVRCATETTSEAFRQLHNKATEHAERAAAVLQDPAQSISDLKALQECRTSIAAKNLDGRCESVSLREGMAAELFQATAETQMAIDITDCVLDGLSAPPPKTNPGTKTASLMVRSEGRDGR